MDNIIKCIYRPMSTVTSADNNVPSEPNISCTVYKFQSRPPYEGFVLILLIVILAILFIWWLRSPANNLK